MNPKSVNAGGKVEIIDPALFVKGEELAKKGGVDD